MKNRILFSVFALLATVIVSAQDIIVTTDAQKIEAKITEVSKSEIKYKEQNYLDGPTFVLATDEISSIIYSNGKVVLYNQSSQPAKPTETQPVAQASVQPVAQVSVQPAVQTTEPPAATANEPKITDKTVTILLLSGHTLTGELEELNSKYVAYTTNGERKTVPASQIQSVTFPNGQVKTYTEALKEQETATSNQDTPKTSGRIYRCQGNEYMYNDTYISSLEVARIISRENKQAYEHWEKANGYLIGGAVCFGVAGGCLLGSIYPYVKGMYTAAIILDCVSVAPFAIGLGLTIGALTQQTKAIDLYNSKYDQAAVQLRWSVAPNGLGLALAF